MIFPRTFRTPTMSLPPRVIEPVYEDESEYERKVDFDIKRNSSKDGLGKEKQSRGSLAVPGPKVKKDHLRDREGRKGQPPPSSILHGYKYANQHPKSILKRTESYPSPPIPTTGQFLIRRTNDSPSRAIFRQTRSSTDCSPER